MNSRYFFVLSYLILLILGCILINAVNYRKELNEIQEKVIQLELCVNELQNKLDELEEIYENY